MKAVYLFDNDDPRIENPQEVYGESYNLTFTQIDTWFSDEDTTVTEYKIEGEEKDIKDFIKEYGLEQVCQKINLGK